MFVFSQSTEYRMKKRFDTEHIECKWTLLKLSKRHIVIIISSLVLCSVLLEKFINIHQDRNIHSTSRKHHLATVKYFIKHMHQHQPFVQFIRFCCCSSFNENPWVTSLEGLTEVSSRLVYESLFSYIFFKHFQLILIVKVHWLFGGRKTAY